MSRPYRTVHLTVMLPAPDHRVFQAATALLREVMGARAPSLEELIRSKLVQHDVSGLVEDYLELRKWPEAGHPLLVRTKGGRRDQVAVLDRGAKTRAESPLAPLDPSRN